MVRARAHGSERTLTTIKQDVGHAGYSRRGLLGTALALPLAGCGRAPDASRLSLWAMDVEGENAKRLLPAFTRTTGTPVDLQWLAWTAAHEKLLTAFAGGSLPDVFMVARNWVAEFALIGAIRPIPHDQADLLDDIFHPHDLRVRGRDLAVPWTLDLSVQYYRRDLLARAGYAAPPRDLDAWRDMLRAIKRVQGDGFAVLMQLNWPDHLLHLAEQQPDPLLRDNASRGNFGSPGFKAALGFYKSLFDEGLAPRVSSIEAFDPAGDFARGWIAVYPAGAWTRADLLRRKLIARDRWSVAPMAGRPGGARVLISGAVLCVSATAADPARAWALVRYLTAPPTELRLNDIAGTLPSRPSAWTAPVLAQDAALRTFEAALRNPVPTPNLAEWERITNEVQLVAERLVRGGLSIDEATAEMDRRADAILAKRRWLLDRGRIA